MIEILGDESAQVFIQMIDRYISRSEQDILMVAVLNAFWNFLRYMDLSGRQNVSENIISEELLTFSAQLYRDGYVDVAQELMDLMNPVVPTMVPKRRINIESIPLAIDRRYYCPVCMSGPEEHPPFLLLPCGHTLCKTCVENLERLCCAECRQAFQISHLRRL